MNLDSIGNTPNLNKEEVKAYIAEARELALESDYNKEDLVKTLEFLQRAAPFFVDKQNRLGSDSYVYFQEYCTKTQVRSAVLRDKAESNEERNELQKIINSIDEIWNLMIGKVES